MYLPNVFQLDIPSVLVLLLKLLQKMHFHKPRQSDVRIKERSSQDDKQQLFQPVLRNHVC